jgi:uncharacterized protein with GYD domain
MPVNRREESMPRYMVRASYSVEGEKGLMTKGGTARKDALEKAITGLGGTMEAFYFAFGEDDVFIIAELPDNASAAALSLTAGAAGGVASLSTIVLLTPAEIDDAANTPPDYRPPGSKRPRLAGRRPKAKDRTESPPLGPDGRYSGGRAPPRLSTW